MQKPITTKRLVLAPLKKAYFGILYNLIKKNNRELSRWTPISYSVKKKKTVEFYRKTMKKKSECIFVITDKKTKKVLGQIHPIKNELMHSATIGYWIGKKFRKKGYMTEATQAVIAFCFEKWKVMRVEIAAEEKNNPSQRVIEKCGLQFEGIRRMGTYSGLKKYGNLKVYSILKLEWEKKKTIPLE